MAPLILTNPSIKRILRNLTIPEFDNIYNALTSTLHQYSTNPGTIQQPHRQTTTHNGQTTLFMPSSTPSASAIKVVSIGANTPVKGTLQIFSATGELEGLLNAEEITAFRTALASMVMLRRRQELGVQTEFAMVFGTGKQAEWAIRLLIKFCPELVQIAVVGRSSTEDVRKKIADRFVDEPAVMRYLEPIGISELVENGIYTFSPAVFCCTPSTEPLFPVEWARDGRPRYISLIGSYKPHMKEIEPAFLKDPEVKVVVDSKEACLQEAGEILQSGIAPEKLTEVGEFVGGQALDRSWAEGTVVFKCVGMGCMDLVAGQKILELAREKGYGIGIDEFD